MNKQAYFKLMGLRKEAAFRKRALKGIGAFNPKALSQLAKSMRSFFNPIGRAAKLGPIAQRFPGGQGQVARTVLQNLKSYMKWNAQHFDNEDALDLLFRRAVGNPEKYKGAMDIITAVKGLPDYTKATQNLAKKTNIPADFLAKLLTT